MADEFDDKVWEGSPEYSLGHVKFEVVVGTEVITGGETWSLPVLPEGTASRLISMSPWRSGTPLTNSFKKSNLDSELMQNFLQEEDKNKS